MLPVLVPALLACAQSTAEGPPAEVPARGPDAAWTFEFESQETLVGPDSFIQVHEAPVFRKGNSAITASWAVLWLDRREMGRLAGDPNAPEAEAFEMRRIAPQEDQRPMPFADVFSELTATAAGRVAREMYLEGPVEVFANGERMAVADAIYLDLVQGHGWIANATARVKRQVSGVVHDVRVRADWMRYSSDGSLRADSATVTTGDFEDSSLSIYTGDLRIRPAAADDLGLWEFRLRENRLHLVGNLYLPLPPLTFNTEESGKPIIETFGFGDSARLGNFLQATFNREMGSTGAKLNEFLAGDPKKYRAHYGLRAWWLGSRGILTDLSADLESQDHYWLRFHFGITNDDKEDRGLVRVDPDERSSTRRWQRAQGRYIVDEAEWIDLRYSEQSDPAVQSEFFEREYLSYEKRDNDVHWRKAEGQDYFSARAKVRLDDYRTTTEELPSLRFWRGATDVGSFLGAPVLYASSTEASQLHRREGDPRFDLLFEDGLGDREVVRVHTRQELSFPVSLGWGGLRAVPYVAGVATGWDRNRVDSQEAGRAAVLAGLRLATTLWRTSDRWGTFTLSPLVGVSGDLASEETEEQPVRFDALEDSVRGEVLELGLRAVWRDVSGQRFVDLSLRDRYSRDGGDGGDGDPDAWDPLAVFLAVRTPIAGIPVGIFHDGRYSSEGRGTVYSLTDVGLRLSPDLAVELSHRRGLEAGAPLFETAAITGRYRWTEKWEFEARHEISLFDQDPLEDSVVLRRYGRDLILDLQVSDRAGEGSSVSFRVEPALTWSGSDIGEIRSLD